MIVTRQRKQKRSPLPILLPIAAIIMVAIALTWPPSRNFITNGPLHPVVAVADTGWQTVSKPLSFAYQQQQITDRNLQIKTLNDKLEVDRKSEADKDAQVTQLQKQVAALNAQPTSTEAPDAAAPAPVVAGANGAAPVTADLAGSAGLRRAAQQWTAMDPERAAALVQKLPVPYVSSVFAQMSPDAVGPIMDALPPGYAAQIVQGGNPPPQYSAQAGR